MTLDVAIATWQPQGIERIVNMNLPTIEGVRYIVSWQKHENAPMPKALKIRKDIEVWRTDVTNIAENRNNALNHCTADIVLNGDDDLIYTINGLNAVINTFVNDKALELACFKFLYNNDSEAKPYPDIECSLKKMPKNMWVTTFEMAVRRNSPAGALRFDYRFGPGAEFLGTGEDEYYLLQARRCGYNCKFFPITIGEHPQLTHAGQRITNTKIVYGMGGVIGATYRVTALPRIVLKAWRMKKAGQYDFLPGLIALLRGYFYLLTHPRKS